MTHTFLESTRANPFSNKAPTILSVCVWTVEFAGNALMYIAFGSEVGFRKACCLTTGRVGNLGGVFLGVDRLSHQLTGWHVSQGFLNK